MHDPHVSLPFRPNVSASLMEKRRWGGELKIVAHPEPGGWGWRVEIDGGPILYRDLPLSLAQNRAQNELITRGGGQFVIRGESGMVLSVMTVDNRNRARAY